MARDGYGELVERVGRYEWKRGFVSGFFAALISVGFGLLWISSKTAP